MKNHPLFRFGFWVLTATLCGSAVFAKGSDTGVLLMAHGGSPEWNKEVQDVAAVVDKSLPVEVAFGMADRAALQAGINQLAARGVKRIVAVPLFVSSHSSVIESIKYLLGQRADAPKDLALFAVMHHDHADRVMPKGPHHHAASPANETPSATAPVKTKLPVSMAPALDRHPVVADILFDRAAQLSQDPRQEALILVAHGPNDDQENAAWLADMKAMADRIGARTPYERIACITLRDDAEPAVRDKATAELRHEVQKANDAEQRALIVPLLLSYGGIEHGLRQRLDGLEHVFSPQALLPDPRIAQWVLASVQALDTK